MHRVTGRWRLGLALSLTTAACWGVLPIALKIALQRMDPYTISWYRFAVAALVLAVILAARRRLPDLRRLDRGHWRLLAISLAGLLGNYLFYLTGLAHSTPAIAQTVVQLAPFFLMLAGLLIYKERFSRWQWVGLAVLIGGLLLFFNRRLPELVHMNAGVGLGVLLVVLASILWTAYAVAQKALLKQLSSPQIMWLIYVGAVVVLLPATRVSEIKGLGALHGGVLAFCCANTLIGYGAFSEALEHWEVSRVSAVIAAAPVLTLVGMWAMGRLFPGVLDAEHLTLPTVTGALLVVAGSALCALGERHDTH